MINYNVKAVKQRKDNIKMENNNAKAYKTLKIFFSVIGVLFILMSCSIMLIINTPSTNSENSNIKIPEYGSKELIKYEIKHADLGFKLLEITTYGIKPNRVVTVKFDTSSSNTSKFYIQYTLTETLRSIQKSGYHYDTIVIWGVCNLVDPYGNESLDKIFQINVFNSTMKKINWKNFDSNNLFQIVDSFSIHPALIKSWME
jgi:hypothetical protein